MKIQRDAVVATALELLDEVGLDGVTMRVLAKAMHIQAPSLYWHFPNKKSLIDSMAEALLENVARTLPSGSWEATVRMVAGELRQALLRRRDGARVYAGTYVVSDNVLRVGNVLIAALSEAGADSKLAAWGAFSILYYVLGFTMEEQGMGPNGEVAGGQHSRAFLAMTEHAYPAAFWAAPALFDQDLESRFAFGLDTFIAGLRSQLPASTN